MEQPSLASKKVRDVDDAAAASPRGVPQWSGGVRRWLERVLVAGAMALVVWFFHWTVEANRGFDDQGDLDYFKLLVRGWKKGQLSLDKAPAPELLALADPYDPAQNGPYKLGDTSLYKGKYYIYFGPTPALTLMLPYGLITGREMTMGTAVFVFVTLAFLAASGLWLAIRRRYFPGSGLMMAPLGVLALGGGTHLLALAQRPMIWELPISAAIAFTLLAVGCIYRAIHGRRTLHAMAAAGLCLGLGVGARPTCLFACGMLAVPLWVAWREGAMTGKLMRMAVAAALPLGLCGLALMAHNYARFENPLEWGQNYQLSGAYEGKLTHFSLRFLAHNVAVYFFQALRWTMDFPFAQAVGIEINHIPGYFGTEEVAGLMVTFPFFWFLLALPLAWAGRSGGERLRFTGALAGIVGYALPVGGLVMCYFSTTTRYQADFAVVLAVLAVVGLLGLERWAQTKKPKWRRATMVAAVATVGVTMIIGALMSLDYHSRSMRVVAPLRWRAMQEKVADVLTDAGVRLGKVQGPTVLKVRFVPRLVGTVETFWRSADSRAGERILVQHIGERLIRFGWVRGNAEVTWGRELKWENNHTHTVSVQVPSLYSIPQDSTLDRVRAPWEFRQRTSVAVWFSGGQALDAVVPAPPADIRRGGEVGEDFSGQVRDRFTRAYRRDEIPSGLSDEWAPRGGVLRMRVMFPDVLQEEGEPLFASGVTYRSSMVFVEKAEGGARFTFESYTIPRAHSVVFRPKPEGHVLELELPTFDPRAFGVERTGDVVIRLDGVEVMRQRQLAYWYPTHSEVIGTNPFGTTCALDFRGWIRDARWIQR